MTTNTSDKNSDTTQKVEKTSLPPSIAPSHLQWGTYHRKPISYTFVFMIVSAIVIWFTSYYITSWFKLADSGILSNSRMYSNINSEQLFS